jgi:hypothetical protein
MKLPNTLSSLIFEGDQNATLVQQSLTAAVQPILDFINRNFVQNGLTQALSFANPVSFLKTALFSSGNQRQPSISFTADNTLGLFYDPVQKRLGIVQNNQVLAWLSQSGGIVFPGTVSANSFVSATGFKAPIPMGTFWSGGTMGVNMPTNYAGFTWSIYGNGGMGGSNQMAAVWVPDKPGSVIGMSAFANGSLGTGNTATVGLYISGSMQPPTIVIPAAGGAAPPAQIAKGVVPFTAGQSLGMVIKGSASNINQSFSGAITVEMGA